MDLGKVVGTVVATAKEPKLTGKKLLLINLLNMDTSPTSAFVVALDGVGAGRDEVVIVVRGSSARIAKNMDTLPTDASVIAIVDAVELAGRVTFKK
jgi:ethanolamine utilization protein EutN